MEVTRVVAIATVVLALGAPAARAQPQSQLDEAKSHFKNGTELYDENNFRGALIEFHKAYELAPSYKILFNIGQVEMELQDYAGALTAYTRYLREGGPDVPRERVTQVSGEIDRLRGRVGRVTIQSAAGAEVLVDDVRVGYAPLSEPVVVNAGRHQVTIKVAGHDPETRTIDVAGQEQATVVLGNELPASRPSVTDRPTVLPGKSRSKTPMIAAWTVTGAFAVGAVAFGFVAHSDANDLETLRNMFPVTKSQLDDKASSQTLHAALADGFGVAAIISGGIAVYFTLTRPATSDKVVHLGVTPNGAFVAGRF